MDDRPSHYMPDLVGTFVDAVLPLLEKVSQVLS